MPVALQFDLIKSIVEHGVQFAPSQTVDPSTHPELRRAGNGIVTTYIEQLSLVGIVSDPFPLIGADGGMWIGYQLSDQGRDFAASETDLRRAVARLTGGPKTEVSEAVAQLREECQSSPLNDVYKEDFLKTLDEIRICFDNECFIATIVLCGKILEVCLKEILGRHKALDDANLNDPNLSMGRLLRLIREHVPKEYVDPALGAIANLINESRNTAIHAKERIPVPSRDQAIMVIFATRDVVRRNLSHQKEAAG